MNVDFDRFLRAKRRFSRRGRPARIAGSLFLRKRCAGLTIRTANNASHGRSPDAPVGGRVSQSHPPAGLIVIIQYLGVRGAYVMHQFSSTNHHDIVDRDLRYARTDEGNNKAANSAPKWCAVMVDFRRRARDPSRCCAQRLTLGSLAVI